MCFYNACKASAQATEAWPPQLLFNLLPGGRAVHASDALSTDVAHTLCADTPAYEQRALAHLGRLWHTALDGDSAFEKVLLALWWFGWKVPST